MEGRMFQATDGYAHLPLYLDLSFLNFVSCLQLPHDEFLILYAYICANNVYFYFTGVIYTASPSFGFEKKFPACIKTGSCTCSY